MTNSYWFRNRAEDTLCKYNEFYLEISKFGESVDNDAEDDVEADGGDEDEEGQVMR